MRTKRKPGVFEERMRRVVRARLQRGQRATISIALGHDGSWMTNWLKARQDATIDEIYKIAKALRIPLGKVLDAPDAAELDWEVFGLMAQVPSNLKPVARRMVSGLVGEEIAPAEREPTASSPPRRQAVTDRRRKQA